VRNEERFLAECLRSVDGLVAETVVIDTGSTDRTVEIAENLVGLRPVAMAVTDDTSIVVRDKRGGLGDLTKDLPVRAFYEVRNDVKYVTSIKVIADDAQATVPTPASADTRPPVEAQSPTETEPLAPPDVASALPAARPVPPSMTDRVSASFKTAASPAPTPSRAPAPTAEAAPSASAARPADTEVGDGSAAVDWLLKESHRR